MKNVVITGFGINSCIGNTYKDVLGSLQQGKSGISFNDTYSEMGFRRCISGSIDRTCKLWDIRGGSVVHTLRGHNDEILDVCFNNTGTKVVTE